jgi:hypothetical protein
VSTQQRDGYSNTNAGQVEQNHLYQAYGSAWDSKETKKRPCVETIDISQRIKLPTMHPNTTVQYYRQYTLYSMYSLYSLYSDLTNLMQDTIKIKVWDANVATSDKLLARVGSLFTFAEIMKLPGCSTGLVWCNLYGAPGPKGLGAGLLGGEMGVGATESERARWMNERPHAGSAYRGRLLLKLTAKPGGWLGLPRLESLLSSFGGGVDRRAMEV